MLDERLLYKQSEVALDFNAGFQSCTAGVLHHIIIGAAKEVFKYSTITPTEQPPIPVTYNTTAAPEAPTSSAMHLTFNIILFASFYILVL